MELHVCKSEWLLPIPEGGKAINLFIEFLKKYHSKTMLHMWGHENLSEPLNSLNFDKDKKEIEELEKVLVENNLEFIFLFGGCDYIKKVYKFKDLLVDRPIKNIKLLFWPTFLLHACKYDLEHTTQLILKDIKVNKDFEKLFICLNYEPRHHRCVMMDKLFKNDLFKYGHVTWNKLSQNHSLYNFSFWKEKIMKFDMKFDFEDDSNKVGPKRYYSDKFLNLSYLFNVVGETSEFEDVFFITEKTYKNLLLGIPFICYGATKQNTILKEFGFKLYDEIFDYTFDDFPKLEDRLDYIVNVLNDLKDKNYNEIYSLIQEKIEFNKNRCYELFHRDPYVPKEIIKYVKLNPKQFENEKYLPKNLIDYEEF